MSNELKLMVGDWVLRNGIETKVTPNILLSLDVNPAFAGNIQPIKLTPEIMEMAGFEYDKITYYKYCFMLSEGNTGFTVWYKHFGEQNRLPYEFEYLHQLQQLIRLFTGEEIEVKWEK